MNGCTLRNQCGFFQRFEGRESRTWREVTSSYCHGNLYPYCRNYVHFRRHGNQPDGERMPSGETIPEVFLQLK